MLGASKKDRVLQIRLPEELRERFKKAAAEEGFSVSDLLRNYIETYLLLRDSLGEEGVERLKRVL